MTTLARRPALAVTTIVLVHALVLWQLASQRSLPSPAPPAPNAITITSHK
jgi:ABC-type nitrate/sulfonate/bicarbonate transport system permease component